MVDRSVAPVFTAPKNFTLPQAEIIHLKNGSTFFSLPAGDQPVVKLEFIFKAGVRFETQPGVAFFTAKMLTEGTKLFNSKTISETLDQYGAFVEINPGFDYTNLSIYIPTAYLGKIEKVISELLFEPTFPEEELEILKHIQTQQVKVNQQKNNFVASRLFRSKLFPENAYGHIMDVESIKAIKKAAITQFYDQWINGKFDIFLTGQFDESIKKSIIRLVENNMVEPHVFDRINSSNHQVFNEYLEKEDSLQSAIFLGQKCVNRTHETYPNLLLLNEVFGGYFGSRLMQNIREEKGLTYSIYSRMASLKDDAYFVISSDVKKESKDEAIEEINKEIAGIKNEIIGADELEQAKNHLRGSILNTLTNPFAITEKLKNIYFYDLGINFYDHLFEAINLAEAKELNTLANEVLFEEPLSSVIVG